MKFDDFDAFFPEILDGDLDNSVRIKVRAIRRKLEEEERLIATRPGELRAGQSVCREDCPLCSGGLYPTERRLLECSQCHLIVQAWPNFPPAPAQRGTALRVVPSPNDLS